jgi:hypothetical protein
LVSATTAITTLIEELEALCADAERALVARHWDALMTILADQRRVIAELTNTAHGTAGERTPEFDQAARQRIRRIYAFRDNQLKRLEAFRDNVRGRLTLIAKVRQAGKQRNPYARRGGLGHLDLLR